MKPPQFRYATPASVDEALALLSRFGDEAKVLAGGQSLMPLLNFRLSRPGVLVDINRLSELEYIRRVDGELHVGGLTRQRALETSPDLSGVGLLLRDAVAHAGHVSIRNLGTVGGSLAHADPAAELPAAVTALRGQVEVRGPSGPRRVDPGVFFKAFFTTSLTPDELVTGLVVPDWPGRTGTAFHEVSRRAGDFAIVGVAAAVAVDDAGAVTMGGFGVCGAGETPVDGSAVFGRLVGRTLDQPAIEAAADELARSVDPRSDGHGSAEYRRNLVRVLGRRALGQAYDRARATRGG